MSVPLTEQETLVPLSAVKEEPIAMQTEVGGHLPSGHFPNIATLLIPIKSIGLLRFYSTSLCFRVYGLFGI